MHVFSTIRQVALRLLLAYAVFFAAMQSFRLLLLPAIQHLFHTGDAATSLVRRTGIFCFILLGYWVYVRCIEKRPVTELRLKPLDIAVGGLSGALLIGFAMALLFAGGAYVATAWRGLQSGLWGVACFIIIAALMEELVYRGILFRILETGWGTVPALWVSSGIFALMHLGNLDGHDTVPVVVTTMVSCVLASALWTMVYVHSRNLWVSTANHAAWNFTILLSGLPLSGLEDWRKMAPLASEYRAPDWLTGGIFGPEDSLVTLVLLSTTLVVLFRWARAKQRLGTPSTPTADGSTPPPEAVQHG